jgi:hypothetical protein
MLISELADQVWKPIRGHHPSQNTKQNEHKKYSQKQESRAR